MGAFTTLNTAGSGMRLGRTWLDAVAHNLANLNTINPADAEPFRAKLVVAREQGGTPGRGVQVTRIVEQAGDPPMVYDPTHPLADEEGTVTLPMVDMGDQMADLILAQRSYQANLSVVQSARDAYQSALQLGRA